MEVKEGDVVYCYDNEYCCGFALFLEKVKYSHEEGALFVKPFNIDCDENYPFYYYKNESWLDEVWNYGNLQLLKILYGVK